MKKPLAITILVLGSAPAIFGAAIGILCLMFLLFEWSLPVTIALVIAAAFGIDCLRRLFRRKYGLNAGLFFLCVYAPSVAVSVSSFVVISLLNVVGLGEFIMALVYIITAFSFAAAGGIWLAILTIVGRKRSGKPALGKPAAIVVIAVGGAVVWTVWNIAAGILWEETGSIIPMLLIISGVTLGIELLRYAFAGVGVRTVIYYICAYYMAVFVKAFAFYVYFERLTADKKYGFPTDADNKFFLWYVPIEAAAAAVFAVLWFALLKVVARRKEEL